MSPSFYLPTILCALHASLVQMAPLETGIMEVDRVGFPEVNSNFEYTLITNTKLYRLRYQLEEADYNLTLMQLLQLNMMKIMLLLDIFILIFLFIYAKQVY